MTASVLPHLDCGGLWWGRARCLGLVGGSRCCLDDRRGTVGSELPHRWAHTQGVADRALVIGDRLGVGALAAAAAILHDVGYSSKLVQVGFHPIDGARHLRRLGLDPVFQVFLEKILVGG